MSGYVISKPPSSPALFWHQDWWGWDDPSSYTPLPQQLFLMYYLVDTTPHNGCLRLLRGSHLQRHRMHDEVPDAHTDELRRVADPDHPAYQSIPEEVDVPVAAGDVVIGDSRLLHSAHANKSAQRRTVITLWYFPYFDLLSDGLRAAIARPREWVGWDDEDRTRVADLLPTYDGAAEPVPRNRMPERRSRTKRGALLWTRSCWTTAACSLHRRWLYSGQNGFARGFSPIRLRANRGGLGCRGQSGQQPIASHPDLQQVFDQPEVEGALTSILGPGYYLHPHRFCPFQQAGFGGAAAA